MHPGGTQNFNELFSEIRFGLNSKNKWPLVASVFYFEASKSYFPTPSPFSSWSQADVCLCFYPWRTVPTSQMYPVCPVCWSHPFIEYAIHTIHEVRNPNSISQTLKISRPTYWFKKGMSKRNQCLLPLNLLALYDKENEHSSLLLSLWFLVIPTNF